VFCCKYAIADVAWVLDAESEPSEEEESNNANAKRALLGDKTFELAFTSKFQWDSKIKSKDKFVVII